MTNPQGRSIEKIITFTATLSLLLTLFIPVAFAQKDRSVSLDSKVYTPTLIDTQYDGPYEFSGGGAAGNPSCATLNALDNSEDPNSPYFHMSTDWEMKLDFSTPNGTYPIANGGGVVLSGGITPKPDRSISVTSSGAILNGWTLSGLTTAPHYAVSAVIVKGGNSANVYLYPDLSFGDIVGPFSTVNGQNAISHLTFCFEPFTAPTAADGTISGRTIKMDGTGIASARVEVLNLSTGEILYAVTNPFGYYTFEGIETNDLYMVTVSHKRHQFANPQRTINFDGDLVDLDFVAF